MMPLTKSPRLRYLLEKMGVFDSLSAIEKLPRRYEDFSLTPMPSHPSDKERLVLLGRVDGAIRRPVRFKKASLVRFPLVLSNGGRIDVEAWNRDYLASILKAGDEVTVLGKWDLSRRVLSLVSVRKGKVPPQETLKAVHSLPDGLSEAVFQKFLLRCFEDLKGSFVDPLPPSIREKYRLLPTLDAYREAQFPTSRENLFKAMRSLKYLEAFLYELLIVKRKDIDRLKRPLHERKIDLPKFKEFVKGLPFELTDDQKKAVNEAYKDLSSPFIMYRLLQGDVGSGKTLVSALVLYLNYCRGYQGALLAPTEALARQHFESLFKLYGKNGPKVVLLLGGQSADDRRETLQELASGEADIVVGTHAVFSKGVVYAALHLAVVDEQHKFGVAQRLALFSKGETTDVYMMSATPIPRSLAQAVYGDLDISSLHSFPSGKRDVETLLYGYHDSRTQEAVRAALAENRRVYVVAKEIHGSDPRRSAEEIFRRYSLLYPGKVVLATGEMDASEIEGALASFRKGKTPILVATQVVEVGLDVKDAGLMIVYDASRFALSSLHQLRGRIGRDGKKATFVLLSDSDGAEKLSILLKSDDGFKISEEDLRLRGPGDMFGTKQSGDLSFALLDPVSDLKMLSYARADAIALKEKEGDDFEIAVGYAERDGKSPLLA